MLRHTRKPRSLADELIGCEAAERLEGTGIVLGVQKQLQVRAELAVAGVVVSPDGGLLERAVNPLGLTVIRFETGGAASFGLFPWLW